MKGKILQTDLDRQSKVSKIEQLRETKLHGKMEGSLPKIHDNLNNSIQSIQKANWKDLKNVENKPWIKLSENN